MICKFRSCSFGVECYAAELDKRMYFSMGWPDRRALGLADVDGKPWRYLYTSTAELEVCTSDLCLQLCQNASLFARANLRSRYSTFDTFSWLLRNPVFARDDSVITAMMDD